MSANSNELPKGRARRHWLRFSLRSLLLLVTLSAIAMGLWTQRGKWFVMRLTEPDTAAAAWEQLLTLNRVEVFSFDKGKPLDVWPQKPGSFFPGYVWVRQGETLRCATPWGEILRNPTNVDGARPQVLWNGTLPDGEPGLVIFHARGPREYGYLLFMSTIDREGKSLPIARMMVRVHRPDVTATVGSEGSGPTIRLCTNDGTECHDFVLPYGPPQRGEREENNTRQRTEEAPWQVVDRW